MTCTISGNAIWTTVNRGRIPLKYNGEQQFAELLGSRGYRFKWEPITFHGLPPDGNRAFTPDVQLLFAPSIGRLNPRVYLELTVADHLHSANDLPQSVRHRNRLYGDSRQEFISAEEYLERKRAKVDAARQLHGIRVMILGYYDQLAVYHDPMKLIGLVKNAVEADPLTLHCLV
jgi:hypothetical protein